MAGEDFICHRSDMKTSRVVGTTERLVQKSMLMAGSWRQVMLLMRTFGVKQNAP